MAKGPEPINAIGALRDKAEMSKTELAKLVGCTKSYLGKLEDKDPRALSVKWVMKFAGQFGCQPAEIFDPQSALPDDELELLQLYRRLTKEKGLELRRIAHVLLPKPHVDSIMEPKAIQDDAGRPKRRRAGKATSATKAA